jgi:DNA-binding NarL/FixJ family response regulator
MIRILLVDDQATVRQGWRMRLALEPDIEVVGEAANGAEALQMAEALEPDVILLDLEMPVMDGLLAAGQLVSTLPDCTVIMVSMYDSKENRRRALLAGASAFFGKQQPMETLLSKIRDAAE